MLKSKISCTFVKKIIANATIAVAKNNCENISQSMPRF